MTAGESEAPSGAASLQKPTLPNSFSSSVRSGISVSQIAVLQPPFETEHDLEVNLRAGVRHRWCMPLLTELENGFPRLVFYKDAAPDGASERMLAI